MDYDKVFGDDHLKDKKFFYTDYPGNKLMVGKISLKKAISRLNKDEYYVLVTYSEGDELPKQYVPFNSLKSEDGTLFATVNSDVHLPYICRDGGIQRLSRIPDLASGSPNYLLGPGPDTISLEDLIMEQYDINYGKKSGKGR